VETGVRVRHIPTGITVENTETRSQLDNRQNALRILKSHLYDLELKKRRARILVQMHFDEQRKKQADKPDHSPSRYLDEKQKGK
jgi:peptide chain release factor 2